MASSPTHSKRALGCNCERELIPLELSSLTLRAQRLKHNSQDRPPGLKISSGIENFKRAFHETSIFVCGEFWTSRIENFKQDWTFQTRFLFFLKIFLWTLRDCSSKKHCGSENTRWVPNTPLSLVAWFARIDSRDSCEFGDSRESEIRVIQANRPDSRYKNSHPAAKGVRQKESGKKVTKKVTKASEKVTESVPKTKKSDRTPFAALLMRHPEVGVSIANDSRKSIRANRVANRPCH